MKKLKKFEEYMDSDSFYKNDKLLPPTEEEITPSDITSDQFEMMCNDAFMEDNINIIKNVLSNLKFKYVTADRPDLKNIYMNAVKKWHIRNDKALNL